MQPANQIRNHLQVRFHPPSPPSEWYLDDSHHNWLGAISAKLRQLFPVVSASCRRLGSPTFTAVAFPFLQAELKVRAPCAIYMLHSCLHD